MASFFEKLKRGMGVDENGKNEQAEEVGAEEVKEEAEIPKEEQKPEEKEIPAAKPKKKPKQKTEKKEQVEEKQIKEEEKQMTEEKEEKTNQKTSGEKEKWSNFSKEPEGQLAIDVYQTENELVLQSAIAGVKPESIDISIEGDMVTIRGNREKPIEKDEASYFYQECFWGRFQGR
jgi:HSP20 family molecular chaperone IbpA